MISRGNVNKVMLVGRLGNTPELRHTEKGNAVTTLSLATNREFRDAQGKEQKEVTWHRATVWGKAAEACVKHLTTGQRVHVEGDLRSKSWIDKAGIERKTVEINVYKVDFLDRARASEAEAESFVPMPLAN